MDDEKNVTQQNAESEGTGKTQQEGHAVENLTRWQDGLPDDLKNVPSLADIKDVNSLAQIFVDTKQKLGGSVRIPTDDAGAEDISSFVENILENNQLGLMRRPDAENTEVMREVYKNLGMPDEPSGYEAPEGADAKMFGAMTAVAHELGLSKKQMAGLASAQFKVQEGQVNEMIKERDTGIEQLRGEWGMAYDEKAQRAGELIKAMGGHEALEKAIAEGNVDSDTLRLFDKFATQMGQEGSEISRQINQVNQSTPDELRQRRDEITKRLIDPKEKLTTIQRDDLQKKMLNLSEQILAVA